MEDGEDYDAGGDLGEDLADVVENFDEVEAEAAGTEEQPAAREVAKESRALQQLTTHHPECRLDYVEQVQAKLPLSQYPPDSGVDAQHRSVPYLTLFEKTKIIGFRANQLANGARPFVMVPAHITDVLEIARQELEKRRLPFILKRPMPDGSFEQWRLSDLIIL